VYLSRIIADILKIVLSSSFMSDSYFPPANCPVFLRCTDIMWLHSFFVHHSERQRHWWHQNCRTCISLKCHLRETGLKFRLQGFTLERICVGFLFTFIMVYLVYTIDASCKNTYYL
jgi:hypothetical protein